MQQIGGKSFPGERRRYPRLELSLALAYQWGTKIGIARTNDVGMGGLKIQTEDLIPFNARLDLTILIGNEAIKSIAKVVWSDPTPDRKYDVGICFEGISDECLNRLERFLYGTSLGADPAKWQEPLEESGLEAFGSRSFDLDRLKANFLRWLRESYPRDYQRYADQPKIGENEIRDFLKSKGIDEADIYYVLNSLRGR